SITSSYVNNTGSPGTNRMFQSHSDSITSSYNNRLWLQYCNLSFNPTLIRSLQATSQKHSSRALLGCFNPTLIRSLQATPVLVSIINCNICKGKIVNLPGQISFWLFNVRSFPVKSFIFYGIKPRWQARTR